MKRFQQFIRDAYFMSVEDILFWLVVAIVAAVIFELGGCS